MYFLAIELDDAESDIISTANFVILEFEFI